VADESEVNILMVDDLPANLLALEAVLAKPGLRLVTANSGDEALRRLLKEDFALILLDVQMPGLDGFETAALIRQRGRSAHTPIIFLTAHSASDAQLFRGYAAGAVDYLTKPIVPDILRSKVEVFVDLFQKTERVRSQEVELRENQLREHQRELAQAQERIESARLREEIRLAREIQQRLFPTAALPLPGVDVGGASFPAEATGGDYFDYIPMLDGALAIVIGDVSGHGFGPALLMSETRAYVRAFMMTRTDVGEIVSLVNQALVRDELDDRFTTLILVRLDPITKTLVYTSAGHTTCYVLNSKGEVSTMLTSTDLPLGILSGVQYESSAPIHLLPGDTVLLLSDGIVEAHLADSTLFGVHQTLEVIRANRHKPARDIVNSLYSDVRAFCRDGVQLDDMTAVVVKIKPEPSEV
jgi:serine phosphatase RsbU (regulator of sigma subunit)